MKITEAMRTKQALEMIEEASTYAQSLTPERDWKESHDAINLIYTIVHSIRSPECRKNHPKWSDRIDKAIMASRKRMNS